MEQHMDTPIKIAFGNKSRTGKDTAVEYLQNKYGGVVLRLAEPLYEITNHIQKTLTKTVEKDPILLQNVASLCRQHYGEPFADFLMARLDSNDRFCPEHTNLFVVDTRIKYEADQLRSRGFIMVVIDRPDRPIDRDVSHISEVDLDNYDWDFRIVNDGTLQQFYTKLDNLVTLVRSKTVAMLATKFLKTVTTMSSYNKPRVRPVTIDFVHVGDGVITDEVPEDLPTTTIYSNMVVRHNHVSPRDAITMDIQELQNEFIPEEKQKQSINELILEEFDTADTFVEYRQDLHQPSWHTNHQWMNVTPEEIRQVDELHTKFNDMGFKTRASKPLETLEEWGSGICSNPPDETDKK